MSLAVTILDLAYESQTMRRALGSALIFTALLAVATADAACATKRCGLDQRDAVAALRAEIDAACDCAGAESPRAYKKCAKDVVRIALGVGRIS